MDSDQEEVRTVGMVPVALVCLQHTQQWKIEPADYSNKEEPPPRKTKKNSIPCRARIVSLGRERPLLHSPHTNTLSTKPGYRRIPRC